MVVFLLQQPELPKTEIFSKIYTNLMPGKVGGEVLRPTLFFFVCVQLPTGRFLEVLTSAFTIQQSLITIPCLCLFIFNNQKCSQGLRDTYQRLIIVALASRFLNRKFSLSLSHYVAKGTSIQYI